MTLLVNIMLLTPAASDQSSDGHWITALLRTPPAC